MKQLIRIVITFYIKVLLIPLRSPAVLRKSFFRIFLNSLEDSLRGINFTGMLRLYPSGPLNQASSIQVSNTGILIQGPISNIKALKDVEITIQSYLQLFPGTLIVLSIWNNSLDLPKWISENPLITIIRNPDPGPSWPSNLMRQIVSTHAGLAAFPDTPEFMVVKTRTDQRFSNSIALTLMQELVKQPGNSSRVWVLSYGTGKYRIYGVTDQFQFGLLRNLKEFWELESIDTKMERITTKSLGPLNDLQYKSVAVHEILLSASFLVRRNHRLLWTWPDYESCLAQHFGILDSSMIDFELLSRKRTPIDHVLPGMNATEVQVESHLSYSEWLLISQGFNFLNPTDEVLIQAMKVPDSDLKFVDAFWKDN